MYKTPLHRKIAMHLRGQATTEELIKSGMKVGSHFSRRNNVDIDGSHAYMIEIGDHVTLAGGVRILAHDASTKMHLGYTKIAKVIIGNYVFLGADCIVMPGVTIGDRVIIGSGSVVTKDIPAGSVAVGNPARVISDIDTYLEKCKAQMQEHILGEEFERMNANEKRQVVENFAGGYRNSLYSLNKNFLPSDPSKTSEAHTNEISARRAPFLKNYEEVQTA